MLAAAPVPRGRAAELQHPCPQPACGAQLGDRRELLVGRGVAELDQRRGLVDVEPARAVQDAEVGAPTASV